uniref:PPPDE domain-containing protein n=1 Tax=Macrostomum lignano TaxID=282301 RepID=A0A1I8FEN7_9PLAT
SYEALKPNLDQTAQSKIRERAQQGLPRSDEEGGADLDSEMKVRKPPLGERRAARDEASIRRRFSSNASPPTKAACGRFGGCSGTQLCCPAARLPPTQLDWARDPAWTARLSLRWTPVRVHTLMNAGNAAGQHDSGRLCCARALRSSTTDCTCSWWTSCSRSARLMCTSSGSSAAAEHRDSGRGGARWPRAACASSRLRRSLSRRSSKIGSGLCNILLRNSSSVPRLAAAAGGILVHKVNFRPTTSTRQHERSKRRSLTIRSLPRTELPAVHQSLSCSGGEFSSSAKHCWSATLRLGALGQIRTRLAGVLDLVRDESGIEADEDTWKKLYQYYLRESSKRVQCNRRTAARCCNRMKGEARPAPEGIRVSAAAPVPDELNQFRAVLSRDFTSSDEEDETASGSGEAEDEQGEICGCASLVWESAAVADIKRRLDDTFYARFATVKAARPSSRRCQRFDGAESNRGAAPGAPDWGPSAPIPPAPPIAADSSPGHPAFVPPFDAESVTIHAGQSVFM